MKKSDFFLLKEERFMPIGKILKIMKVFTFVMLVFSMHISASSYSQNTRLSLNLQNVSIKQVLTEIENQSEFRFLYSDSKINVEKIVEVAINNKPVKEILLNLFEGTDIRYKIAEKQILLFNSTESPESIQQQKSVTGKVTDSQGATLPGVSVVVKGTTIGVITDTNGSFSLSNVPVGATIVFSFVGMTTQEIAAGTKTELKVVMSESTIGVDEVIVIGYGTAKRKDYTGSVSSLKMENSMVSLAPNLNAIESLKGNIAGLNVGATTSAGGEPIMDIRGQNSMNGSNSPLIVLDGVIYLGSLSDINPNDIATYDILKDAVSSSAYGSRSANGVIAITTKVGKTGKPVITFNTSGGVQTWQNQPVMMKGEEWINTVNARNRFTPGTTSWMRAAELANLAAGTETDFLDHVTRTGVIQDYQLAVSGAAQNVNYYLSASYNDNKGIVVGDDFNRISLLGKVNTTISSWLKIGVDGSYSKRDYSGFRADVGVGQTMSPYGVMYRDDQKNLEKYPITEGSFNPLWGVQDGTRENLDFSQNFRLNAYAVIDVPWVKGLNFKTNILTNLGRNESGNFTNENYFVREGVGGLERYAPASVVNFLSQANGIIASTKTFSYVFDNILNYKNTFKKHSIEATLVATRDYLRNEQINSIGSDFANNGNTTLGIWGLAKATVQKVDINIYERTNIGYLGRLSYSFNDKYFLTTSYRRDGASVFGANNKWADFAGVGGAWKITNEAFMKNFKPLNNLKLKLTWGQNGNQGIGPYATLSTILNGTSGNVRYEFSNAEGKINYGLYQNTIGNSDLGWESTNTWNTGFESAWLNDRLFVDLDLYSSQTTNQIFLRNIPVMTGFRTMLASMGQINNKGVELTLRSVNIKTKDLSWTTSVIYWKNANKLVKLYGTDTNGDGMEDDDIANSLFIGKSLGAIYGFEQDGIVQATDVDYIALTGAAPGAPKYKDLDRVPGISTADRKILGYSKENFMLNMSNSIFYKNFEMYAMITGTFGGNNYFLKSNIAAYATGIYTRYYDNNISIPYWTPENKSNVYPSAYFSGDSRYQALQSRGFVRVQDVSLAYTFKQPWVKTANINSLKVFISAKNLATMTNWSGGDPELGSSYRGNIIPVPTIFSIGAIISF
jgi:TonB-linked SusC/RagA family outer membrane protein